MDDLRSLFNSTNQKIACRVHEVGDISVLVVCFFGNLPEFGAVTSRVTVSAPLAARSAILEVFRALAMTLWPRERASRAMYFSKPDEAAEMNQTGVGAIVGVEMLLN